MRWRSKALAESQCLERPALIFRWTDLHLTPQYLTKAFLPPWLLKVESEAAEWWILPSVSVFTFSSFRGEESLLDDFKYRPESRDKVTWHTHVNYSPFFKTFGFSDTKHIFKTVKSRSGILIVIDVVGESFLVMSFSSFGFAHFCSFCQAYGFESQVFVFFKCYPSLCPSRTVFFLWHIFYTFQHSLTCSTVIYLEVVTCWCDCSVASLEPNFLLSLSLSLSLIDFPVWFNAVSYRFARLHWHVLYSRNRLSHKKSIFLRIMWKTAIGLKVQEVASWRLSIPPAEFLSRQNACMLRSNY